MSRLLIAEKPSVARDIARVLNATRRSEGQLSGAGWTVTWCIGHLVELVEPQEYDPRWKRWTLSDLPMIPEIFLLRPIRPTIQQYHIVRELLLDSRFEGVVNACDAGREGELIFRYVYQLSGSRLPIQRLWISSMTDEAIRAGLQDLRSGSQFLRLHDAARSRSEADWLVGLNATRALTVRSRAGQPFAPDAPVYSVGRVQTPTLAMLADRETSIATFVPEDYWQLAVTFEVVTGRYVGKWFKEAVGKSEWGGVNGEDPAPGDDAAAGQNRFLVRDDALVVRAKIDGRLGQVTDVERKRSKESAPLLFDLTRLQRTANKRYGFSAARTLELAQSLYERHKLITYPRTDSTHLSSDMVAGLRAIVAVLKVGPYVRYCETLLALDKLPISKRCVDDKKVSDHHAIIPTPKKPDLTTLSVDERQIYDLIVRRFLGIFFPDAVFDHTRVVTTVESETFLTRGKVLVNGGWREVAGLDADVTRSTAPEKSEEDEHASLIPELSVGDSTKVLEVHLLEKQTQPPPRFTEGALLAAMEGAGKTIDDEELQQAMRESGLGTPATRASIIETLIHRHYVVRRGKSLLPTERGMLVIQAITVESLRSPQLTGLWEARLSRMARGDYPYDQFISEVRDFVREIVMLMKQAPPIRRVDEGVLPESSRRITEEEREVTEVQRSREQSSGPQQGRSRTRAKSVASGLQQDRGSAKFPAKKAPRRATGEHKSEASAPCPRCRKLVTLRESEWACVAYPAACGFVLPQMMAGKTLSEATIRQLLIKRKTRLLRNFVSPRSGIHFSAVLALNAESRVVFEAAEAESQEPAEKLEPGTSASIPDGPSKRGSAAPADVAAKKTSASRSGSNSLQKTSAPNVVNTPSNADSTQLNPSARAVAPSFTNDAVAHRIEPPVAPAKNSAPPSANERLAAIELRPARPPVPGPFFEKCPVCPDGQMIRGREAWGCSNWRSGCKIVLTFEILSHVLTEEEVRRLLRGSLIRFSVPDRGLVEARFELEPEMRQGRLTTRTF